MEVQEKVIVSSLEDSSEMLDEVDQLKGEEKSNFMKKPWGSSPELLLKERATEDSKLEWSENFDKGGTSSKTGLTKVL